MRTKCWCVLAVGMACTAFARADLIQAFSGFNTVWEVGTSGLKSSYDTDTKSGLPVSGPLVANFLPTFGPQRVSYPNGIGAVPSPGGLLGTHFDQGALGVKIEGGNLVLQLATGLDAATGYFYSGWNKWFGQGDLFIDVADGAGVSHFAALSAWSRDPYGRAIALTSGGHFDAAQAFHVGDAGHGSLEGHLVRVTADADVTITDGAGEYGSTNAPAGLDLRIYAAGGTDRGNAGLVSASLSDRGQNWYIQTWTVSLASLSPDASFNVALHAAASCGNDQIGVAFSVPEPSTLLLVLGGLATIVRYRRAKMTRSSRRNASRTRPA